MAFPYIQVKDGEPRERLPSIKNFFSVSNICIPKYLTIFAVKGKKINNSGNDIFLTKNLTQNIFMNFERKLITFYLLYSKC